MILIDWSLIWSLIDLAEWKNYIKTRAQLQTPNYRSGRERNELNCSLCILRENENEINFIVRCRILTDFRIKWLHRRELAPDDVLDSSFGKLRKGLLEI